MKNNDVKFTLPLLDEPRTVRVKFRKVGNLQYISHLDLQRSFARILVRAGLPLWYTQGFNPHIKMVFGMPLPVGCESECEYLDIRLERDMSNEEIKARLNAELTAELAVSEVYVPTRKFTDVAFAAYDFTLHTAGADEDMAARVRAVLQKSPLTVLKKSKSGEKEIDLSAYIRTADARYADGNIEMRAVLAAGEGNYVSPEALVTVLRRELGILSVNPVEEYYHIVRRRVLLADGVTPFD